MLFGIPPARSAFGLPLNEMRQDACWTAHVDCLQDRGQRGGGFLCGLRASVVS